MAIGFMDNHGSPLPGDPNYTPPPVSTGPKPTEVFMDEQTGDFIPAGSAPKRPKQVPPRGAITSKAMRDAFSKVVRNDREWMKVYDDMEHELSEHRRARSKTRTVNRELRETMEEQNRWIGDQANRLRQLEALADLRLEIAKDIDTAAALATFTLDNLERMVRRGAISAEVGHALQLAKTAAQEDYEAWKRENPNSALLGPAGPLPGEPGEPL